MIIINLSNIQLALLFSVKSKVMRASTNSYRIKHVPFRENMLESKVFQEFMGDQQYHFLSGGPYICNVTYTNTYTQIIQLGSSLRGPVTRMCPLQSATLHFAYHICHSHEMKCTMFLHVISVYDKYIACKLCAVRSFIWLCTRSTYLTLHN